MEHGGGAARKPVVVVEDGRSHVLVAKADAMQYLSGLVFMLYSSWAEEEVLALRRQLREVAVSSHGCILASIEGLARLLVRTEEGLELDHRVSIVRDAVSSLPRPCDNLPPQYVPDSQNGE